MGVFYLDMCIDLRKNIFHHLNIDKDSFINILTDMHTKTIEKQLNRKLFDIILLCVKREGTMCAQKRKLFF